MNVVFGRRCILRKGELLRDGVLVFVSYVGCGVFLETFCQTQNG